MRGILGMGVMLTITLVGCAQPDLSIAEVTLVAPHATSVEEVRSTPEPTPLPPTPPVTLTLRPTATAATEATATPDGCQRPIDDYSLITEREHIINMRTFTMLRHANTLYDGDHDFVLAITQGSYNPGVGASFGTHDGGGAVDISVRSLTDYFLIFSDDFGEIILALRQAGFAAWVREQNELYSGSALHIHAIAVGDRDLSEAAQIQLTGSAGYFRGYNGLPEDPPIADKWGQPIICPWMLDLGYADLRDG